MCWPLYFWQSGGNLTLSGTENQHYKAVSANAWSPQNIMWVSERKQHGIQKFGTEFAWVVTGRHQYGYCCSSERDREVMNNWNGVGWRIQGKRVRTVDGVMNVLRCERSWEVGLTRGRSHPELLALWITTTMFRFAISNTRFRRQWLSTLLEYGETSTFVHQVVLPLGQIRTQIDPNQR